MAAPLKGKFKPKNPQKYKGNPTNIIFRSSWERDVMSWLDTKKDVIWWQSEEKCFGYMDETTNKYRRYFPDFIVCFKRDFGEEVRVLEVKPAHQCNPPKLPKSGRKTPTYKKQCIDYIRNQCKWKSMRNICEDRGWNFQVITEENVSGWKR